MKIYSDKIIDIVRKYSSFGLVKSEDEQEIESLLREQNLVIKEEAYNRGFIDGVKSSQRMESAN
jgi:hypothetical protein